MKIAMVGYGRMGKKICEIIRNRKTGDEIVTIDKFNPESDYKSLDKTSLDGVNVAIDFSFPDVCTVLGADFERWPAEFRTRPFPVHL